MMENIFENAHFGKLYKTRDGRKAIYNGKSIDRYWLIVEHHPWNIIGFNSCGRHSGLEEDIDIISEWQEEINEEELDELATRNTIINLGYNFDRHDHTDHYGRNAHWASYKQGWKDAYRKAKC